VRLRRVLDLLGDEAIADRPGRELVLQRLLELMLVEAIRTRFTSSERLDNGLIAGLGDTKVAKALRAMHADVQKKWTVGQLAEVAGMSRSVFAERFGRVVDLAPIDYLVAGFLAGELRDGGGPPLSPEPYRHAVRCALATNGSSSGWHCVSRHAECSRATSSARMTPACAFTSTSVAARAKAFAPTFAAAPLIACA
jgi:AraC-like DNA-binding protein